MSLRHTVRAALLGQLLAGIIALTAICSTLLVDQGVSAPTLQSSLNYLLLGAIYTAVHVRTSGWRWRCRWWAYMLLAWLDVEANACLVLAFRFTSLTSVTLLDCFTIPMAVVLSAALLGAAYSRAHYAGAGICIAGLLVLVTTDRSSGSGSGSGGASNPLLGDGLVLLGATLYALSNVLQEWLLGDVAVEELLGTLGLWGCVWSVLQGLPTELPTLLAAHWTPAVALPFCGFGLAMFAFYSLVPYELRWGGAALLNISLLASDLWTALARYFFFGGFEGHTLPFFCLSLAIVACGTLVFTAAGDVDTKLGAGSASARAAASLPVAYHRVPGSGGGGSSSKDPQEALEELQRQHQALREAPPAELPNPFDVGGRGRAPAFMPLPAADEGWAAAPGSPAGAASSPLALEVSVAEAPGGPAAAAAGGGGEASPLADTPPSLRRGSFDIAASPRER